MRRWSSMWFSFGSPVWSPRAARGADGREPRTRATTLRHDVAASSIVVLTVTGFTRVEKARRCDIMSHCRGLCGAYAARVLSPERRSRGNKKETHNERQRREIETAARRAPGLVARLRGVRRARGRAGGFGRNDVCRLELPHGHLHRQLVRDLLAGARGGALHPGALLPDPPAAPDLAEPPSLGLLLRHVLSRRNVLGERFLHPLDLERQRHHQQLELRIGRNDRPRGAAVP